MNIESTNINHTKEAKTTTTKPSGNNEYPTNFADELKEIEKQEETLNTNTKIQENVNQEEGEEKISCHNVNTPKNTTTNQKQTLDKALNGLNSIVQEFNQSEDNLTGLIKNDNNSADNNSVINNDFNIQDNKEILPQMTPNMNFSGNGQPFSSFMDNETGQNKNPNSELGSNVKELAEEAAILSTMAENIAMANKNQTLKNSKIITDNEGIKKVNTNTNIKIEDIVKFDSVIMNEADVDFFVNLIEKGEINLNNIASNSTEKSIQVSKTLLNLLAKSIESNQPVRIDFDNNISVIIKISRDGKITADFLPSSQIAEAYLKENLPLLRQRFDENNIEYESLNQRERREHNKENNRKKERNNE